MSTENRLGDSIAPPIGRSWLETTDEKRKDLFHINLEEFPTVSDALTKVIENINLLRSRMGVPVLTIELFQIRFVDASDWRTAMSGINTLEGDATYGFRDNRNKLLFIKCEEDSFGIDEKKTAASIYVAAHGWLMRHFPSSNTTRFTYLRAWQSMWLENL